MWLVNVFLAIFLVYLEGVTIHMMWGWFVTPTFGVIQPNVLTSIGLGMLAGVLCPTSVLANTDTPEETFAAIWNVLMRLSLVLVVGYFIHFGI